MSSLSISSNIHSFIHSSFKIDGTDKDLKEIIDAYAVIVPAILIFRKGSLNDFRGPNEPKGIAAYILEDVKVRKEYLLNKYFHLLI
jgi:hypothetical protein